VKPTTHEDYAFTVRKHLKPALGHIPVQLLTPATVQSFYSNRLDAGIGPRTVELCHGRLSQALALALREGVVTRNVCAATEPPATKPRPADVWTAEESRQVIAASEEDLYAPLWLLALGTGLRRGELLGLRWQDLDLTRPSLSVRQTVVLLNNAPAIQTPKTSAAQRTIKLSAEIVDALGKHRLRQIERRLAAPSWNDPDLVFCTAGGKPINPNSLYDRFDAIVIRAGVKRIPLHGMRHTHATLLLAAGTPIKAVSERLGHSKTSITLDTYAHVLPDMQDRAVDAIDAALFRDEA
jgi:integrase